MDRKFQLTLMILMPQASGLEKKWAFLKKVLDPSSQ